MDTNKVEIQPTSNPSKIRQIKYLYFSVHIHSSSAGTSTPYILISTETIVARITTSHTVALNTWSVSASTTIDCMTAYCAQRGTFVMRGAVTSAAYFAS